MEKIVWLGSPQYEELYLRTAASGSFLRTATLGDPVNTSFHTRLPEVNPCMSVYNSKGTNSVVTVETESVSKVLFTITLRCPSIEFFLKGNLIQNIIWSLRKA